VARNVFMNRSVLGSIIIGAGGGLNGSIGLYKLICGA
jgi:hypothetical protein